MATTITMPQLGETVTEGTVAQWLKKPGDSVEKYEAFVEVSTDKVNAEVPAPVTGIIKELLIKEGETVAIGVAIAIIEEVGAVASTSPSEQVALRQTQDDKTFSAVDAARAEANRQGSDEPVPGGNVGLSSTSFTAAPSSNGNGSSNGHAAAAAVSTNGNGAAAMSTGPGGARVSPAVRRLAREHNISLDRVRGTGEAGRITANDIINASQQGPSAGVAASLSADNAEYTARPAAAATATAPALAAKPAGSGNGAKPSYGTAQPGETIALTNARKLIAQRMVDSLATAPHAWTMVEIDVTNVWKWRTKEKDAFEKAYGVKLTLLPFFIRAVVESLAKYPLMNSSFTDDGIRVHRDMNVGIAAAVDANLIVPVIRGADQMSIKGIALAAGELIDKARRGKLGADDLSGGMFTVNNTGANGSVLSKPILVPGQTGIVTTEAIVKRPVVRGADDAIVVRSMMNVCLSLDHRVVDGSIASGFLFDLKTRLEAMGPSGSL